MADLTTRAGKGSPLTNAEVDANFTNLNTDKVETGLAALDAYDTTIADTAVDVFVYDTSRDSDGGAWRHRTQHTSWYNETLNTATRGSRREFPAVAVIVAEANQVTIYDGDDPSLPMWMVFNTGGTASWATMNIVSHTPSSLGMFNGVMSVGSSSNDGAMTRIQFVNDFAYRHHPFTSFGGPHNGSISERNELVGFTVFSGVNPANIVNGSVNDVAMTVLPNAPIDAATGLPVPTIAVATNGGVSVIKDDGTVVDSSNTANTVDFIAFDDNYSLWLRYGNSIGAVVPLATWASDGFGYPRRFDNAAWTSTRIPTLGNPDKVIAGAFADGVNGFGKLLENQSSYGSSMVSRTTSDYATGWMNGDIKLATLSDTDDTDVTGSELVTNGTFDTDTSGWTAGLLGDATFAYSSGTAVLDTNTSGINSNFYQNITTVTGKTYTVTFDFEILSASAEVNVRAMDSIGSTTIKRYDLTASTGTYSGSLTFVATGATTRIRCQGLQNGNEIAFDNISVRLAEPDRSVNGNGLGVYGTITKDPVATGADLVAYSGFSASNYLEQPYNSALPNLATDPYTAIFWIKKTSASVTGIVCSYGTDATGERREVALTNSNVIQFTSYVNNVPSTSTVPVDVWTHVAVVYDGNSNIKFYFNGVLDKSSSITLNDISSWDVQSIGAKDGGTTVLSNASLALLRISGTAPSAEQIAKIYEDEKFLFQEGAQATLYGSSDAVTALAHDEVTDLLHVGTSAGRSVFQGLRRVDNTTDAVGVAISAYDDLVVED